jgi:hypothetical protein
MASKALSAFLIAVAFLGGAAFAQNVAPNPRGPVIPADAARARSLQNDVSQLSARVTALEAGMTQLSTRVTQLNQQLTALDHHRHHFTDNTGSTAAHDITDPPSP